MRGWCVYMHEHRDSGKKYIGITGQRPEKRWKNGRGYQISGCCHNNPSCKTAGGYHWQFVDK